MRSKNDARAPLRLRVRLLPGAIVILAFACGLAGYGPLAADEPAARPARSFLDGIRSRGTLVVASLSDDLYPFRFRSGGADRGYDRDLAELFAKTAGVPLVFDRAYADPDGIVAALRAGKADLAVARLKQNLDNALVVDYSAPYLVLGHALVANRVRLARRWPADESLAGLARAAIVVGAPAGGGYEPFIARRFPAARIRTYPGLAALERAVLSGEVDAAYGDETEARELFRGRPERAIALRYFPIADASEKIVVYLPPRQPAFAAWVSIALEGQDATLADVMRRYQEEPAGNL